MNSLNILLILVFSIVMLFFMFYPAMKTVEFIAIKYNITEKQQTILTIVFTIFYSLCIGIFLKFA